LASQNQVDAREKIRGKVTFTPVKVEASDDTAHLLEVLRTGAVSARRPPPGVWFVLDNKVMRMKKRAIGAKRLMSVSDSDEMVFIVFVLHIELEFR
jgi:hypothetical protein